MREEIWNLFLKTGNIETYLLLKQLETDQLDQRNNDKSDDSLIENESMTMETKV